MTSKPDLGLWIGVVSGVAVVAAIIVGLVSVGGPGDARAYRLDEARLAAMQDIVSAARCAYAYTDRVPATFDQIGANLRERRRTINACARVEGPERDEAISYAPEGADHIKLCAEFLRPSAPDRRQSGYFNPRTRAPELEEPRASAGRHCFSVRLAKQFGDDDDVGP